ncbi:RNA 2',3'-cyclic phosphodiesterase [Sphingomonas radiodurans]|uniref:RNA 2',3'-cyclic phosphodiesterase n=1 Tax=Sphingomonas radiodurans TaxID=2890321 RepID=UPI001E653C62|nr:RNA 2',3'-cyclic phosphodiesterase [Sphingomonas radiodurans]WBH17317.1 RNA 2',3'-cyclic phosphodiesterase [Sphingomonas radiodurans]
MHRLFVALRPPSIIRDALVDTMDGVTDARWQDDEQLHLTLRFIGAVDRPVGEDVAASLTFIHAAAPTVSLAGVGQFDRRGKTDTLWAALMPHDALTALHHKIDQALVRIGLEPERRAFLPHITLARLARGANAEAEVECWLARHAGVTSAPFVLPHLILYESHLGRAGAEYEPIARWPLA